VTTTFRPRRRTRGWRAGAAPAALTAGLLLAACGGGSSADDTASGPAPSLDQPTSTASTTTSTAPRKPCTPANLQAAAAVDHRNATVEDATCSSAFAVATLMSSVGTQLAYFGTAPDGSWVVLKVAALEADPVAESPPGVPATLATGWKSRYDARLQRAQDPGNGSSQGEDFAPTTEPPPPPPPPELPPELLPPEQVPPEVPAG
jgi:hypothetical protein